METNGLPKAFGTTVALDEIDLRVEEDRILGLIGANVSARHAASMLLDYLRTYITLMASECYGGTLSRMATAKDVLVERVQTGIRIERRILKVLKATAELKDMSVGDLLEGIVLHAFEGKSAFGPGTLKQIGEFQAIYGLTLRAADSHNLRESNKRQPALK